MGLVGQKNRSVKLVVDGMDEFDVRLDDAETKFNEIEKKVDDVITVMEGLVKDIAALKKPAKKAPAKKAPAKKAAKK
tara:strand:- start:1799 stop:2029 length:231 start_codon:yes stop_codon:yes gene_type:complete